MSRPHAALAPALALSSAGAVFLAATPWLRAYQVPGAPYYLALAAVVPFLIGALVSPVLRFTLPVSYAVSALGLVLVLGASAGFDYLQAWSGLARVPAQLLTETLPLGGGAYLLAPPLLLTWVCAAAAAELLLRPTRPAPLALALPVAYFGLSFAATTSAPTGATGAEAAGLLGAVVVSALVRQALVDGQATRAGEAPSEMDAVTGQAVPVRRHTSLRRALTGGALAGLVVAGSGVVVSALPAFASKPATLSRPTQLLGGTVVDPLDQLAASRASTPARKAFTVQVDKPWDGYITVAILDQYDGDEWSFSATFRPSGGRVPSPPLPGERSAVQVVQNYILDGPTGLPFLPALERPLQVDGVAVDTDAATGMLAANVTTRVSYRVVSSSVPGTSDRLAPASDLARGAAVPGGDTAAYTDLPSGSGKDIAAAVRFAVNLTGRPASGSFAFLQGLASSLRVHERTLTPGAHTRVPAALGGTSLAQVINAVTVDRAATPEQFATFVAVVARDLGVPARVVTGFRAPQAAITPALLPAGRYTFTDGDAWAWAEVPVQGYGWVVVDPTPVLTTADISAPPEAVTPAPPAKANQATALPGRGAAHALAKPVKVDVALPFRVNWALLLGAVLPIALAGAVVAVLLGGPALRRRLRRLARHHSDDPALLAAGAWLELVDGLSRLGLEVAPSATSAEVVAGVGGHFGPDYVAPTRLVADLSDQALYSTRWPLDQDRAELAWGSQHQLYQDLRRQVGRRQRARSLLLVGPGPARPAAPMEP